VKHILVVDDDSAVLDLVGHILEGYRLTFARDPDEALSAARRIISLELLITDYLMPSMTGEELIGHLRAARPGVKVLIMTGHAALLDREQASWWLHEAHVGKPFTLEELRTAVKTLIGSP
jgi:CheY-like chemotaxis protein